MMHWRVVIVPSLLIIICVVFELHTHHTKFNVNVTKSWLTNAEFANALSLSLHVSQCANVYINGEFTIHLL